MVWLGALWAKITAFWVEIAAAAAVLVLVFMLGWAEGSARKQHAWDIANTKAVQQAKDDSAKLAENNQLLRKAHDLELQRIRDSLDVALQRLRDRPARLPDAARTACTGTTGKELSGTDAEFLARLAADAATADREARACYAREDALRAAMLGKARK